MSRVDYNVAAARADGLSDEEIIAELESRGLTRRDARRYLAAYTAGEQPYDDGAGDGVIVADDWRERLSDSSTEGLAGSEEIPFDVADWGDKVVPPLYSSDEEREAFRQLPPDPAFEELKRDAERRQRVERGEPMNDDEGSDDD